ncbi:response regulator [Stenoxybacter acetivorans]|uniref:response regulator n=1 Tax=Stenoxybacter acetivorans TaxID=422441 RepID=UPI00055C8EB7|nr:response regulator [Stenoxybacter acetivorans]
MHTLLIVDDSNVIRNQISRYSSKIDFEVVATASNGHDALFMYQQFKPDVVTMDLTMPGWETNNMGGMECIEKIIELDENADILVVSALEDKATGIHALTLGARGFIHKPFTEEVLFEALNEVVANKTGK